MENGTLREDIEIRIKNLETQIRNEKKAKTKEFNEHNRRKDRFRSQVVQFLEEFNGENYPLIKPFLEKTPFKYFIVSSGNISIEDDSWYNGYKISLGEKPKIITTSEWPSCPGLYRTANQIYNHGSELIEIDKVMGCRHIIDIANRADSLESNKELKESVNTYKSSVQNYYNCTLNSLIQAVALRIE
jgi:hypothetical protein